MNTRLIAEKLASATESAQTHPENWALAFDHLHQAVGLLLRECQEESRRNIRAFQDQGHD